MRTTIAAILLLVPALAVSQSLGEVAKKERERREKNKQEGKTAIVVSEEDLYPDGRPEPEEATEASAEGAAAAPASQGPAYGEDTEDSSAEDANEDLGRLEDEDVPKFIPPDAPIEERIESFQKMRRYYEQQVRDIDEQIAKNEARLREIEAEIGATSAMGGAGLPVAPQPGTGAVNRQMTGQESQSLVAEQNRLQAMNRQLEGRKEQLKLDLQQKGRAAGVPPGYLRF